jgi:hypothetical protein
VVLDREFPPTPRYRYRYRHVAVSLVGTAWVAVALSSLSSIIIGFGWMSLVQLLVWLGAFLTTFVCVIVLLSQHRWAAATAAVVLCVAGVGIHGLVDLGTLRVQGYYRFHRADFAAVAEFTRETTTNTDRVLPAGLRYLSSNGRVARIPSYDSDASAEFVPVSMGIPDGAVGYAHFSAEPGDEMFDCFADQCSARESLGDGWYWME